MNNRLLTILDFILGIFILMIFCLYNISIHIRYLLSILSIIIIITHSYMLVHKYKQSNDNIFYLSGLIAGAMLFFNPVLGSLLCSICLIILSIFMFFRF